VSLAAFIAETLREPIGSTIKHTYQHRRRMLDGHLVTVAYARTHTRAGCQVLLIAETSRARVRSTVAGTAIRRAHLSCSQQLCPN
jgi:hypothetical protein